MSRNKKIIGVIIGLVIVLAIAIPIGTGKIHLGGNSSNVADNNTQSGQSESGDKDSNSATDNKDGENSKDNSDKNSNGSDSNDADNNGSSSNGGTGSNGGSNSNGGTNSNGGSSKDGSITNFNNTGKKVSSNFKVDDAAITIQRINGYSGIFIEDGSDKEVKNVAAIEVKNTSNKPLEFAQIQLYNGSKKLVFDVSTLPANSSAVVMEKNKASFNSSKGVTYGGTTAGYVNSLEKASSIKCKKVKNNGIEVTNTSSKNIPCVRVFYKYKSSEGYYVGGITYTAKVKDLKAGASQTIYPSHFASDGGEIMMVKAYNSKN
ncbi:hypothetical protein [Intestinibacter bartlettii]|uniref:hypothetical protein n=1 Tax=Intestinibacter bartlettii TaxID=261299 RepID=UPI002914F9C2|nr:hypothetical protein [Intestinibacter bartlettii]MDU6472993.1 hypothetical protein [Intestinibacter bartlettii]